MWIKTADDVDEDALALRDRRLQIMGVRFDKQYYIENYGLDAEQFEVVSPEEAAKLMMDATGGTGGAKPAGGGDDFAEFKEALSGQGAIDAMMLNSDQAKVMAPMVAAAVKVFKESTDYSDAMANLADAYPTLDAAALQDLLARAMFVADTWGRLAAAENNI